MASVGTSFHPLAFEKLEKIDKFDSEFKKNAHDVGSKTEGPFLGALFHQSGGIIQFLLWVTGCWWLSSTQGDHLQTGNPCRWQFNHNLYLLTSCSGCFQFFLNFNKNWLLFTILFIPLTKNPGISLIQGVLAIIGMRNTAIHD